MISILLNRQKLFKKELSLMKNVLLKNRISLKRNLGPEGVASAA
jgi:hypothetical protein